MPMCRTGSAPRAQHGNTSKAARIGNCLTDSGIDHSKAKAGRRRARDRSLVYIVRGDNDRGIADADAASRLEPYAAAAFDNRGNGYSRRGECAWPAMAARRRSIRFMTRQTADAPASRSDRPHHAKPQIAVAAGRSDVVPVCCANAAQVAEQGTTMDDARQ